MLLYYILHRIASKPAHGYEILQDIENKTEGAWRPGAGSIYPILKKLASSGLISADTTSAREARRVFHVTPKGIQELKEAKAMFADFGQRWSAVRGLLIELIDPEHMEAFLVEGSKKQFQLAQEILESKMSSLPQTEVEYLLKEYALSLERQLNWANETLKGMKTKPIVRGVHRRTK